LRRSTLGFVLAYVLGTIFPELALEITGVGGFVSHGWMSLVWRPRQSYDALDGSLGRLCLPLGNEVNSWH
jgi:hypothetical protein